MKKNITETAAGVFNQAKLVTQVAKQLVLDSVEESKEEKRRLVEKKAQYIRHALEVGRAAEVLSSLGDSVVDLSTHKIKQIQNAFPIPLEQTILWADAEFDLRPSGIVATERGVFVRTDVAVLKNRRKNVISHETAKPMLYYYRWDNFDPSWFAEDADGNVVRQVDPQCQNIFIAACTKLAVHDKETLLNIADAFQEDFDTEHNTAAKTAVIAGAAVESSESAVFVEQKSFMNERAGHGELAEEANTILDKLHGLDAKVVGRDNAKDGADRQIGDILIQTKYYKTARGSLEACFDPVTGNYRYMKDGLPMQLEVPKDQYNKVLEGFERKIKAGKVPGVTDPNEAKNIVREGRLTYQQAVNLTKPGTIESLAYDAATGAVICSCAFGITFLATAFFTWRKTGDIRQAVEAGTYAGIQVFGISFLQHIIVSQVSRTGLANALMAPSRYIVGRLGYQTSATIVNGLRALSGKTAVHGAAASKQLAKIMRSNVLTSAITFAVFSVPETYNFASKKISSAQYIKNLSVLTGSIAGGAGGAVGAGVAAAKVAGAAGTAVAPGVGTAVGIAGGFVGGLVGAKAVDLAGNILHEDDSDAFGRLFNAMIVCMASEYLLDADEMDLLIAEINNIDAREFKKLSAETRKAKKQERVLRKFLSRHFDSVVEQRKPFSLPETKSITRIFAESFAEDDKLQPV